MLPAELVMGLAQAPSGCLSQVNLSLPRAMLLPWGKYDFGPRSSLQLRQSQKELGELTAEGKLQ